MKDGFIKTAAIVPSIRVADPKYNAGKIIDGMKEAYAEGARILVLPELSLTGYTCNDLFLQDTLLGGAEEGLDAVRKATEDLNAIVFVGFPLSLRGRLYNTAAVLFRGKILAFIPKRFLPGYGEFYEERQFTEGPAVPVLIDYHGDRIPFGSKILIDVPAIRGLSIAAEICEDAWVPNAPNIGHALAGATMIVNLSASNETVGKDAYRRSLITNTAARDVCAYVYVSSGDGESTQDIVFGGRAILAENGTVLAERGIFDNTYGETKICCADFDIHRLLFERRRMTTFETGFDPDYLHVSAPLAVEETKLTRSFDPHPFVPSDKARREERCNDILNIQSRGLAKRLSAIGCKCAVIGVSGGLDSTLALLVAARAFDLLSLDRAGILAVTMPGFGTTDRTHGNALTLAKTLGLTLKEVSIAAAVTQHFQDIGQDMDNHDVTYENGQARERTQILMDIANKEGGIVIGTGDLSELALGWATYNGDHMSMYGVNAGVPKTLVSHLVRYFADTARDKELSRCLYDVLDTPVSPELLPPTADGKIAQKTEDLVGPYELHDFFLYYMLRCSFTPSKIYRIAKLSFGGVYDNETILKWEKNFYRRFFAQQFKRSCLPDSPKVGSVAVSPRGDLRMPSDASRELWMEEVESLKP
ncbi:MAG TPA: NAD(+) synthase [Lachnospiraceae bacterium]|nr:NAD(+) synthase [Lachnospiraceae bacterium]